MQTRATSSRSTPSRAPTTCSRQASPECCRSWSTVPPSRRQQIRREAGADSGRPRFRPPAAPAWQRGAPEHRPAALRSARGGAHAMIIDDLQSGGDEHRATSSARLRWARGEFRLEVTMPTELAPGRPDASPFLCVALLLAMRLGEHVDVRGPVSAPLLERAPAIVDLYSSWDRSLFGARVRAEEELDPAPRAGGTACFLSRGVDSLYSASTPREGRPAITHVVFCDRLEPMHS